MLLIPMLFPGTIAQQVKIFANTKLNSTLNFNEANLSFFNHFPSLTVTLEDLSLMGSAPFANDTLIAAKEVGFGINLSSLIFGKTIKIDEIFIDDSRINVMINEKGAANYNVYISDKKIPSTDTVSNTSLRLDKIKISHCRLRYDDRASKMRIRAADFNYLGKGSLDQSVFDLKTEAEIGGLDFAINGESYLQRKLVRAELTTRINTNALTFKLTRNDLRINKLPINFNGVFSILKDGYNIDLSVTSLNSNLKDLFTALPPQYVTWLDSTKVRGEIDLKLAFKGRYNKATNQNPTLSFDTRIRNGYIEYQKAPVPMSDIELNFQAKLPNLDTNQLSVKIDSLVFKVGNDYFRSYVELNGLDRMAVKANIKGNLDLGTVNRAVGMSSMQMKGKLGINIVSDGIYDVKTRSFPVTKGRVLLRDASLKTKFYPNPVSNINLDINAVNNDGKMSGTQIRIKPASFVFEGMPFAMQAIFSNFDDVFYDVRAKGVIDLGRIYQVFSQKGIDVDGFIKADLKLKGRQSYATTGQYSKLDNSGTLEIRNIKASMDAFPKPFLINEGLFSFNREKMNFNKFVAHYGTSDFKLNGHLVNAINYFLEKRGTLHGTFVLNSKLININEFMALQPGTAEKSPEVKAANAAAPKASGVILLPTNLDVALTTNADKVVFDKFNLENLRGTVGVSSGKLTFRGTQIDIIGATLNLDGMYDDASATKAGFDLRFRAKNFDIQRAFKEIEMFKELATSAGNAEGIISIDYKLKGIFDANMNPIYPSLEGVGVVTLAKVKVQGMKMFSGLGAKTGTENVSDPDLAGVNIKSRIKDNVIYIDRTKMNVSVFRLRFEGETSFDGQLALKMRLGLPPFGAIGIPVAINGTHSDPQIKVFSQTTEEVDESEYTGKDVITQPQGAVTPVTTADAQGKLDGETKKEQRKRMKADRKTKREAKK